MTIGIKELDNESLNDCIKIWNQVVEDGMAFPQKESLSDKDGLDFFKAQTYTGVAFDTDTQEIVGMYILHPNNVGRCGHICNASYAVKKDIRGHHIGEYLVKDCIEEAKDHGFRILQFNAVVKSNTAALKLYEKLGFHKLGTIPEGFLNKNGIYEDIIPHYISLTE